MTAFIKKIIFTGLVFAIGLIAFVFLVHYAVRFGSDFSLEEETQFVFLGDSHPECAFNDQLISNGRNLAKSGESYFYTYQKVKELLADNQLHAIFLEFSNTQISTSMNDWIWGFEKMNGYFPTHAPFMDLEDIRYLYSKNTKDFPKVISTSTRNNLTKVLSSDYPITADYGGYNQLDKNEIPRLKSGALKPADIITPSDQISTQNLLYLEKIIAFCKSKNTTVYLIRSPQHDNFSRINENSLLRIKNEQFTDLPFLDFDSFPVTDKEFADYGHLNAEGSTKFSLWFNDLIHTGLLESDEPEELVKQSLHEMNNTVDSLTAVKE